MRLFERDGKYNWVDDLNTVIGYDSDQHCCEHFGYYYSTSPEESRNGTSNLSIRDESLLPFHIDPNFFHTFNYGDDGEVVFLLTNGHSKIYLHLYNTHNGYYSHGFSLQCKEQMIRSGHL